MKRLVIGTAVAGGAAFVFRRLVVFMVVGPVVAAAAVAGVVVLAALTSWWVLFALFALPPLMMMVCGPVMMTAMRVPAGSGFPAAGSCSPWRRSDLVRATWSGGEGSPPTLPAHPRRCGRSGRAFRCSPAVLCA